MKRAEGSLGALLAIYHLHAKIVSRAEGRSVVGAAAYRAGSRLIDQRTGLAFDYSDKVGVEHTEILAPEGASAWVFDRSALWNRVERSERRRDAQLARELEIALPVELAADQQVELMRDFLGRHFVSRGMVADLAIHRDNPENPHAHVLLTMRTLTAEGFGLKRREWNAKRELLAWRSQWAQMANEHLARAGRDLRIDHRTLEAQQIELLPGRKLGLSLMRQAEPGLPRNLCERVAEQRAIARQNGERILQDPTIALTALTHQQATLTERDIARYLHTRTDGAGQFQAALLAVTMSPELIALGRQEGGAQRYTTRQMLALERDLLERGERLSGARRHGVSGAHRAQVLAEAQLSAEQQHAFEHVTGGADLALIVGVAGAGKSTLLASARKAWEAQGLTVRGAALAGIAAENLEHASGMRSRTLASLEQAWAGGREPLTRHDVLVIDEAGLIGTRQLARVLERVEAAGAKVVLVGDPEQLQAIEAGAPFRGLAAQAGMAELNEVRRQRIGWQRQATRELSQGETRAALTRYEQAALIHATPRREAAREALLQAWWRAGQAHPTGTRLMLAYTRDDVRELNERARALRAAAGELGSGETVPTERGERVLAVGDRLYFLRNERSLGVKNGSLGTLEAIHAGVLQVRLDGQGERRVAVDTRFYADLDHGYAATVYKAQGVTVDSTFVLASALFDRHTTYVALSRHRQQAQLFYGREDFHGSYQAVLSRARPKALAHDYLERDGAGPSPTRTGSTPQAQQRQGRQAWLRLRAGRSGPAPSAEQQRAAGIEAWRRLRQGPAPEQEREQAREREPQRGAPEVEQE